MDGEDSIEKLNYYEWGLYHGAKEIAGREFKNLAASLCLAENEKEFRAIFTAGELARE